MRSRTRSEQVTGIWDCAAGGGGVAGKQDSGGGSTGGLLGTGISGSLPCRTCRATAARLPTCAGLGGEKEEPWLERSNKIVSRALLGVMRNCVC